MTEGVHQMIKTVDPAGISHWNCPICGRHFSAIKGAIVKGNQDVTHVVGKGSLKLTAEVEVKK